MRIAICDDEEVQCKLLAKYLNEWAELQSLSLTIVPFQNAESFLFAWEDDQAYDLLILDIEMGAMNGMELAMKLRSDKADIPILFVTGYDKYMAQGYEVSALHYLLKPIHKEKLWAVLDRLQTVRKPEEKILLQTEKGLKALNVSDIWYVEAAGHHCDVHTQSEQYMVQSKISEVSKLLEDKKEVVACHRSYLVNLTHVSAIVKTEIILDDQRRLPISRSMNKKVNEAFILCYK